MCCIHSALDAHGCRNLSKLLPMGLLCIFQMLKKQQLIVQAIPVRVIMFLFPLVFRQRALPHSALFLPFEWFSHCWLLDISELPNNFFPYLSFNFSPLVLVLTQFCGLVWPFSTCVCRLSSNNSLCVLQGGAFDTCAVTVWRLSVLYMVMQRNK